MYNGTNATHPIDCFIIQKTTFTEKLWEVFRAAELSATFYIQVATTPTLNLRLVHALVTKI